MGVRSEREGLVLENLVKGVRQRSTQKIKEVNFWVFPLRVNRGKKKEIHHRLSFSLPPGTMRGIVLLEHTSLLKWVETLEL